MPFDGNGNWTSNYNAEADRDAGIKILASRFDNILLADLAQSFQNCLTKDAQVKPQQAFNANNYRVINVANPSDPKDAVNLQTMTGGNNTYTGNNTFTSNITVKMNKPKIFCDDDDETWATDPATDGNAGGYEVRGSDGNWGALFRAAKYTNGNRAAGIQLRGKDMSSQGSFDIWVTSDGSSAASATSGVRASITEWGTPDYTSITAISSGYTAPKNGFYLFSFPQRAHGDFTIGSYTQSFDYNYSYTQPSWCCYPVKKGQAVTFSGCTVYFAQSNGG